MSEEANTEKAEIIDHSDLGLGDEDEKVSTDSDSLTAENPPELGEAELPSEQVKPQALPGRSYMQSIPRNMYMEGVQVADKEILQMPLNFVKEDIKLVQRLITELNNHVMQLTRARTSINDSLKVIGAFSEYTTKLENRLYGPNQLQHNIRQYIDSQNATRLEKAMRAKNFFGNVPFRDLQREIDPRAKIDQVMSAKRPGTDAFRKPHPIKQGV